MNAHDISLKATRDKLTARREPYWKKLGRGEAIGFRRGPDTWVARFMDRTGTYRYQALAHVDEYRDAVRRARDWFKQMATPASRAAHRGTVQEALTAYVEDLQAHNRTAAAERALSMFRTVVWQDKLAGRQLEELDQADMKAWRKRISTPERQGRTVNRYVRAVTAGLNRALGMGWVGDKAAWAIGRLSDEVEETGKTAVFLSPEQRSALLEALQPAARAFFRLLELTGARPRELAAARVSDFDPAGQTLCLVHHKGRPPKARPRDVVLPDAAIELVQAQAADRDPEALLIPCPAGGIWQRHIWARLFREAAGKADLPRHRAISPKATTYSFRHARISELLQKAGLDPVSVAEQTGTSVAMIEKHYMRFIAKSYKEKLARL